MGFVRTMQYHVRAERIAKAFQEWRESFYPLFVKSVEREAGIKIDDTVAMRNPKADRILTALQLCIFSRLCEAQSYMETKELSEFRGHVVSACIGYQDRGEFNEGLNEVLDYFKAFDASSMNPPQQLADAGMALHEAIYPEVDPTALVAITRDLFRLALCTEQVVAQEFKDEKTLRAIDFQIATLPPIQD